MKKNIIVLILVILFAFGCLGPTIEKPVEEGIKCNDLDCIIKNFSECKKAFGTTIEEEEEAFIQILEPFGEKCEVYFRLEKSSKLPEILFGLDAKCKLSLNELIELQETMNIEELDCEGPLYEVAINAKNLGLIQ
ncbi:MAG: hypothetical protein PHP82_01950 [Candidatus ainarchaeum sp.]|nr:hypothetical protein [Candidatus ainarchaeum sp.]